jgi:hypothetical protein
MKRQGELLIIKIKDFDIPAYRMDTKQDYIKENILKQDHRILAEGETTGHKHELDKGTLYREKAWRNQGQLYFRVPKKQVATLTHPEHKSLTFEEGLYKVITQREYEEEGARRVRD